SLSFYLKNGVSLILFSRFLHRRSQEQKDPSSASELIHPSTVNLLWMLCISFVSVDRSEFPDFICSVVLSYQERDLSVLEWIWSYLEEGGRIRRTPRTTELGAINWQI
ncbi:unnamed protein product, partial [Linum tenue]